MSLIIIRHGQTDWNREKRLQGTYDIPLNQEGIRQIKELAREINSRRWKMIITSPLARAYESAKILADELQVNELKVDPRLKERDFGSATGMILKESESSMDFSSYKKVEPWCVLQNRMVSCIREWVKHEEKNDIIFVSHGTAINAFLQFINYNKFENINNGKIIEIDRCMLDHIL